MLKEKEKMQEIVKRTKEELKALRVANLKQNKAKQEALIESDKKIPEELSKIVFSHIKTILNNAEFFLYIDEIKMWVKDHPEWTLKEDIDDLNGIAIEKVIQFRLLLEKKGKKIVDIDKEFTSSKTREMIHRNNLGARRSTRILENKTSNIQNNVVFIAGQIDDEKIKRIKDINRMEIEEDDLLFPRKDVIEITITEEENVNNNSMA